jgi:general secretion pathway protein E
MLERVGISPEQAARGTIFESRGCDKCFQTGYRGRIGIFEIMMVGSKLKSLILQNFDANRILEAALAANFVTLRQDGIKKVLKGITTIEEILRVTQK